MDNIWTHYNGALLSNLPPNYDLNLDKIAVSKCIKQEKALFARWTSDFDCGYKTEWWYCIKDTFVDLNSLSSKQRYRVKRGLMKTDIKKIPADELIKFIDDLYKITIDSFSEYPRKYRPNINYNKFKSTLLSQNPDSDYWGGVDCESGNLVGYAICYKRGDIVYLSSVKVDPKFLNNDVNAALAYKICNYYLNQLGVKYICDGERNIRHETNYQTFLINNLGFRLVYCKLHIVYHPLVRIVVRITYPFISTIKLISKFNTTIYNLYCLLKQEKIAKTFN